MKDKLMELCWNYLHTVTLYHDDMPNEPFKQVIFKSEISELVDQILILIKSNMPKKVGIDDLKPKPCPYRADINCCTMQDFSRNKAIDDCIKAMG